MWGRRWKERKAEREATQLALLETYARSKEAESKRKSIEEVLNKHGRSVKREDYEGSKWLSLLNSMRALHGVRFTSEPPLPWAHDPTPEDRHGPMVCYLYRFYERYHCGCRYMEVCSDCYSEDYYGLNVIVVRSLPDPVVDDFVDDDDDYSIFAYDPDCKCGWPRQEEVDWKTSWWRLEEIQTSEPMFGWQCRKCGYRQVRLWVISP